MKPSKHFLYEIAYGAISLWRKRKLPLLVLFLFSFLHPVFSQTPGKVNVTGTVKDSSGAGMAGVTVTERGVKNATSTVADGSFSIVVADSRSVLVFSSVGHAPQAITVGNQTNLAVSLQTEKTDLGEVVVVGYGTQRKKDLTGAISVVNAEELKKRQSTTVAEALQGLASGIYVRGGGRPGSEAQIQIRGIKNLSNTNPLYVIDGLVTTANRDFNSNDIESIQILKDASAAAIYGSRAANGVIIITTKKGRQGPMKVDFSGRSGVQIMPLYDLAETEEFARLNYMAYDNAGRSRQDLNLNNNTDWQDEAYRTGYMSDVNAGFSGGSNNGSYMISANYFNNKGTVISTNMDRLSLRINTQGTKGIFSIGENIAISNTKVDEMSGNPVADVVRLLPTIPVYDAANPGGYGYGHEAKARTFGTNPVALADLEDRTNENLRIRGNLWSELKPFSFLKYRLSLGFETSNDNYKYLRKEGNWTLNQPYDPAIANENKARSRSYQIENTLTFNKKFGNHAFNLLVGQTYQHDRYEMIWGTKRNLLPNPSGGYYNTLDQGNEAQTGGFIGESAIVSYLGRLEYNLSDKYLLNAVIRRDGSSRLSPDNRWGNFPSVSAAWRISNENFFNVSWINDFKLRASYGTLGSSNIGDWDYLPKINTFSTIAIGADQHIVPGATQVQLVNQALRWEKLTQKNFGFDAVLLNNKLSVTAEYYIATTEDILTGMPIALTTGNDGGNPVVNAATLRNTGVELSATYRNDEAALKYSVGANITTLKNKVIELGYGRNNIYAGNTVTEIGQPIGMWYVLQTDGLFQSLDEVNNYKNKNGIIIQPSAGAGDIRFRDNNGDGQISNDDKVVVGSPWADVELGLNMGASYKGFELSMNWFGSFGATVYNAYHSLVDRFDDNSNYRAGVKPWTAQDTNTDFPRAYYGSTLNSRGDTERWLESGNFFLLKYIGLSYSMPSSLIERIGFSNAQLTLSAQNLVTFTKYGGLDPEFSGPNLYERGVNGFSYPNLKMVSLGIQFGF